MQRLVPRLALLLVVSLLIVRFWPWRQLRHPAGVLLNDEPVQTMIAPQSLGSRDGYTLEAVARYEVTARVLGTKRYWGGPAHNLVPYDMAIGWGRMSDQSVLDQLKFSQGNRFFFYRWQNQPPLPRAEIESHAANLHIIAATSVVANRVRSARTGELLGLRGYLVNVTGPRGFHWRTSLSRTDTGNGACELFYVEEAWDTAPKNATLAAR